MSLGRKFARRMEQWRRKSHNRHFSIQLSCDMSVQISSLPPTQIARFLLLPSDRPQRQGNLNLNTKDFSSFFCHPDNARGATVYECQRLCEWASDPWVSFKWRFNKFETFSIGKHINAINFRRGMADGDPNWWSFVIRISRRKQRRKKNTRMTAVLNIYGVHV